MDRFFINLSTELNINCERTTNYYLGEVGEQWDCDDFVESGDTFYSESLGCSDRWGNMCNSCKQIIETYNVKFKENKTPDKIDDLLSKLDRLEKNINSMKKEISLILEKLEKN